MGYWAVHRPHTISLLLLPSLVLFFAMELRRAVALGHRGFQRNNITWIQAAFYMWETTLGKY